MGNWTRTRLGFVVGGAALMAAGIFFPVVAPIVIPVATGLVGVALRAPGTYTRDDVLRVATTSAAQAALGAAAPSPTAAALAALAAHARR